MLSDDNIDEEIEALLYAQVYYGKADIDLESTDQIKEVNRDLERISAEFESSEQESSNPDTEDVLSAENSALEAQFDLLLPEFDKPNSTLVPLEPIPSPSIQEIPPETTGEPELEEESLAISLNKLDEVVNNLRLVECKSNKKSKKKSTPVVPLSGTGHGGRFFDNSIKKLRADFHIEPILLDRLDAFRETWSRSCSKFLKKFLKDSIPERLLFEQLRCVQNLKHSSDINEYRRTQKLMQVLKRKAHQAFLERKRLEKYRKRTETVYITDSDHQHSDIELIARENSRFMKSQSKVISVESEDDNDDGDEVIYVEPPPVPVIHIDDESGDDNDDTAEDLPIPEPEQEEASNDFIVPSATSAEFNFSLHGSEFQNAESNVGTKGTDTYDTESNQSTSTSDLNRDGREFNNSFKTIVFHEVEFPKDDIFDGNNLDKFGNMIAPSNTVSITETANNEETIADKNKTKKHHSRTLSESSSESDYESRDNHRNLPILSPMIRIAEESSIKTRLVENEENASKTGNSAESEAPAAEPLNIRTKKKRKSKSLDEPAENPDEPVEPNNSTAYTPKKKTKKNISENSEVINSSETKRKKQKMNISEENLNESIKKKNKRKRLSKSIETTEELVEEINVNKSAKETDVQEADPKENEEFENDHDDEVVVIEPVIPVHTIESSESEDNDILTFDDTNDILLGNISTVDNNRSLSNGKTNSGASFDVDKFYSKMSDDPEKWKINSKDQNHYVSNHRVRARCNQCRRVGHLRINCPEKLKIPSCSLCGREGHLEPRCPNKICLSCGTPERYCALTCRNCSKHRNFGACSICKLPGHIDKRCPDLWRRYYLTTTPGPLIEPQDKFNTLIPRNKQWCSGCAGNGHLEHECNSSKWLRSHSLTSPKIYDFRNTYPPDNPSAEVLNIPPPLLPTPVPPPPPIISDLRNVLEQKRGVERGVSRTANFQSPWSESPEDHDHQHIPQNAMPNLIIENPPNYLHFEAPSTHQPVPLMNLPNPMLNPACFLPPIQTRPLINPCSIFPLYQSQSMVNPVNLFNSVPNNAPSNQMVNLLPNEPNQIQQPDFTTDTPSKNLLDFTEPERIRRSRLNITIDVDEAVVKKFETFSIVHLQKFLIEELDKLQKINKDVKAYKKQLYRVEHCKKIEIKTKAINKQIFFGYKQINMFLFGLHKHSRGAEMLEVLENFVVPDRRRRVYKISTKQTLLDAYSYIFGGEHPNVNYKSIIAHLLLSNQGSKKGKK